MDQPRAPRHHFDDLVLFPEKVTCGFDAVAAKVVHSATTGFVDIPKVRAVRPAVRFPRAHPKHSAHAALLDRLARLDHARREHLGFGVSVERAGISSSLEHGFGFLTRAPERLGAYLVLACA